MLSGIVGAIVDSLLKAAFNYLSSVMERRGLIQQGIAQQAAKETATSAKISAAEAQSLAETDRTAQGVEKAAREGNF